MREYQKVTKSYETTVVKKCTCDRCSEECEITYKDNEKRTLVEIIPHYAGDNNLKLDLCPKCTRELLKWFKSNEDIEDFKETLDIWEND